jgi:hypothetical protein
MLRGPYLFAERGSGLNPLSRQMVQDPTLDTRRDITRSSVKRYAERLRPVQSRYPTHRVTEFTTEDIQAFLTIDDDSKPRPLGRPGWTEGTYNAYVSALL